MKTTTNTVRQMTTSDLRIEIREMESPENNMAKRGATEAAQQHRLNRLCRELGRRGED